ncbi:tyrosine-type recombinase/integrase [Nocardia transvalensis]|uniref:tyrosine-type recombinase/integrase n=1 Tax=Nocardia transvalensis TaxID=37333 RepID=UPI001895167E|nr:site-specific integrase [Nocardia transvalensis]MBF6328766.1 site-specific integrase [Nocardia transvalensis]
MPALVASRSRRCRTRKPPTPRPRRRADGSIYYQIRYRIPRDGDIVETSKSFDDPVAAVRWANLLHQFGAVEAERILAAQLLATVEVVTLVGWCRRYADRLTGIEEATRQRYHRFIDRDIAPYFTEYLPIDAFSQDMDAAWVVWLEQEVGNGAKTIANKHGFLSAACAAAARQRPEPLIPYNPCADTRLPPVDGPELDWLDEDEYELLEALVAPRWRPQLELCVLSMARPSEIAALTVGDIDPATGAVSITKAYKYANGRTKLGKPKTRRGVRTAYVPLETVARLPLAGRRPEELLFTTSTGGPITVTYWYKKCFVPALKRLRALAAGDFGPFSRRAHWEGEAPEVLLARYAPVIARLLAKRITPYTLRHTGISWRLQDGVPIWVVSRDAGHESINTTDKRYGHIGQTASAAAAQTVANRLPRLRSEVVDLELVRRRRLARTGRLGEITAVAGGFEAIWMDPHGEVQSQVFTSYDAAVDHVAHYEAGDPIAA